MFGSVYDWVPFRRSRKREEVDEAENKTRPQRKDAAAQRGLEYKRSLLEDQRERETKARASNQFVKHQRIRYHHKVTNEWFDGHVVAVHHDDGPDKPYYTITYKPQGCAERSEKQTTEDRLEPVEFDEEATWEILAKGKR
jgi:hypothetical protein